MLAKHVAGTAKAARFKEHRSQQRKEQFMCGLKCMVRGSIGHLAFEERVDGEEVVLIAFCSLRSGRVAVPTP